MSALFAIQQLGHELRNTSAFHTYLPEESRRIDVVLPWRMFREFESDCRKVDNWFHDADEYVVNCSGDFEVWVRCQKGSSCETSHPAK